MAPTIETVRVVATNAMPGDDAWFIMLNARGQTGWYGPVSAEIGQYVEQRLSHAVIGELATNHYGLHAALCRAIGEKTTPVASWAVGTVDCAAWDLHGQLVQAPVAELLADSPERVVPLYASWLSLNISLPTPAAIVEHVSRSGWRFTKWGLRRGPEKDAGVEAARLAAAIKAVAGALGRAAAFDAVFTWDAALTELVADQVDPADVLWLEDPLSNYDSESYKSLAVKAPLAVGERVLVHVDGQRLLGLRPRAFTLDVVACGGLTRAVDLVAAADAQGIHVYPHGRSFVPAIHLAAAYPDAIPAVEYRLRWEPARQHRYVCPFQPERGIITVPRSPGLGATPRSH